MSKTQGVIFRLAIYVFIGTVLIVYASNHPFSFGSAWTLYYSGKKFQAQKKLPQAEETFKRVIRMQPRMGKAHLMLGVVYVDQQRFPEAEKEFRQALENDLEPINRMIAHNNLGVIYSENLREYELAIEEFNNALKVMPGFVDPEVDPYLGLSRASLAKGDFDQAIAMAKQSARDHPDSGEGLNSLGLAYLAKGDVAAARNTYDILKTKNSRVAGKLFSEINSVEGAENKKQEFLDKFGASLETTDNAALIYSDAGFKVAGIPGNEFFANFKKMTDEIISRGWQKQDEALRGLLEKNRPALEQFRKAGGLSRCDFRLEHKSGLAGCDIGFFISGQTLNAARLALLEAKSKEYDRDLNGALRDYLAILRFIGFIESQEEAGILKVLLKSIVENQAFPAIKGFIGRPDVSVSLIRQLLDGIAEMNNSRSSAEALFREEMLMTKGLITSGGPGKQKWHETGGNFEAQATAEYVQIIDRLTEVLIRAAQKNDPREFERQVKRQTSLLFVSKHPRSTFLAKTWVSLAMSQYFSIINKFNLIRVKEDLLAIGVALRLYELEKAKVADRLEQLVPEFFAALSGDPFNDFKPFSYLKTAQGRVLYSFGPDRRDDRGRVVFDAKKSCKSNACPGDIVF
jgi:tetratricopeptide (TPR) repeat protein